MILEMRILPPEIKSSSLFVVVNFISPAESMFPFSSEGKRLNNAPPTLEAFNLILPKQSILPENSAGKRYSENGLNIQLLVVLVLQ